MSYRLSTAMRKGEPAKVILRKTQRFPDADFFLYEENLSGRQHVGVEPKFHAPSMELALQAWQVFDYDAPKAVLSHDLAKLFDALTPKSKNHSDEEFRRSVEVTRESA